MALRMVLSQKLALNRSVNLTVARSLTNLKAPLPFHNENLPDGEVLDMSLHGLQISQIGHAIMNHFKMGSSDPPMQPLGRWKIEVDNFSEGHKYAYDHSAGV